MNLPQKYASRSRKGLDCDAQGVCKGTDGFLIPSKDWTTGNGLTYTINWDENFGGGILDITAKTTIEGIEVFDTYVGKIEGEQFNDAFKTQITTYLENPKGDEKSPTIRSEVGYNKFFRVIAYMETRYRHFYPSIYGVPKGAIYPRENESDGDGGFGIMQLTMWGPENSMLPTYKQIWNYKENINTAANEVIRGKLEESKDWHNKVKAACKNCKPRIPKAQPNAQPLSQGRELKMDLYSLYRSGGHYWKWNSYYNFWYPAKNDLKKGALPPSGTRYADHAESIEEDDNQGKPPFGF